MTGSRKRLLRADARPAIRPHRQLGGTRVMVERAHRYDGGKKFELDARRYRVREAELGVEWLPTPTFELTAMYTFSDRRYQDLVTPDNRQPGRLLRLQAQCNS